MKIYSVPSGVGRARCSPHPSTYNLITTMKIHYATLALLAGAAVLCNSCVAPAAGYATYTAPGGGISTGVAWTNASYDSNGFPIFGYSYGRPVYGYTADGAAIFAIAALTALCFVPHWGPASWYHGHYHYPHGIHRVAAPPRFPHGHRPAVRPASGIKPPPAPKHHSVVKPAPAPRPSVHHAAPAKPSHALPAKPGHAAPAPSVKPGQAAKPGSFNRPGNAQHHASANRPSGNHAGAASPSANHGAPRTLPAPAGGRAVASVPSVAASRPAISTMPAPRNSRVSAAPAMRGGSSGGRASHGHGGRR